MQTSYRVPTSTPVADAVLNAVEQGASAEAEPGRDPRRGLFGATSIALGDIVLGACAIVGTLVVIVDAWAARA